MIAQPNSFFRRLAGNLQGSAAIETAFVLPVLATMVFGGFEVSMIVSRQAELQTAAAEATAIVVARPPEDANERAKIEAIMESSTGLAADKVSLTLKYRCDTDTDMVDTSTDCSTTAVVSEFIIINMQDRYTPSWTSFGIGEPVDFNITRRVQVS
ncbi:MAG: pilus assembly protein [Sphingomonadales bacterium]|nr:MAG: pilus assembly protein [Sphingomonadales bacterium]